MNLREAILAGAERLERRGMYRVIAAAEDGWVGCALGAAWLGCHPDVSPSEAWDRGQEVDAWGWNLRDDLGLVSGDVLSVPHRVPNAITAINDYHLRYSAGWDELLDALHGVTTQDGTALDEIEVCDESA
jgi:hypothetical protein